MRCSSDAQETTGRSTGSAGGGAASVAVGAAVRCGCTLGAMAAVLTGCALGAAAGGAGAGLEGAAAIRCGFDAATAVPGPGLAGGVSGAVVRACMALWAAATDAGVGWRRIGARGASVAETVTTLPSPTPAAMVGIRNVGMGRDGTADTRETRGDACGRARGGWACGGDACGGFWTGAGIALPTEASLMRRGWGRRCAASQRARRVLATPRTASTLGSAVPATTVRHSAGAQRRTMSRADLRPNSR